MSQKKLIVWFFLLCMPLLFADIPQKRLHEYMKNSLAGAEFDILHYRIYERVITLYGFDLNTTSKKKLKAFYTTLEDEKYKSAYTEIFKEMDDELYNKSINFYKTLIGKKFKYIVGKGIPSSYEEEKSKFEKNKNLISEEKINLIQKINQKINLNELKSIFNSEYLILLNNELPKNIKLSKNEVASRLIKRKKYYLKYIHIFEVNFYSSFTEKELKLILEYVSSSTWKLERSFIINGTRKYTRKIMKNIMIDLHDKFQQLSCPTVVSKKTSATSSEIFDK